MKKAISILLLSLFFIISVFPSKIVKVGWYESPGLQEGTTLDTLDGYNFEYYKMIQSLTDWKYQFIFDSWSELEKMLINGEIDIIGNVAMTPSRLDKYNFSDTPNGESSLLLLKSENNNSLFFADFDSFDGINIATLASGYSQSYIRDLANKNNFSVNIKEYPEYSDLFKAIENGEADAALLYNFVEFPASEYQVLYKSKPNSFYFAVNKERGDILKDLNSAMAHISIGDTNYNANLFERYFGELTKDLSISYTKSDYEYLETNPTVKVLIPDNIAPFYSINNKTGELEGIIVDYYKLIEEKSGLNFEYVINNDKTPNEILLSRGIADIALVQDDFRRAFDNNLKVTRPFITFKKGLVIKGDYNKQINKVGVVNKSIIPESIYTKYELIYFDDEIEVTKAIIDNKIDAGFMNDLEFDEILEYFHGKELQIRQTHEIDINIGVSNKTDPRLYSVLDKTLSNIKKAEVLKISEDNISQHLSMSLMQTIEANIALVTLTIIVNLILLMLVIFLRRLNKLKIKHNYELRKALKKAKESEEAKTLFLLSMSHDLRTPMNSIIGHSELALSNLGDKKTVEYSLLELRKSSNILLKILDELLFMSTIEQDEIYLKKEEFDIKSIFDKIIEESSEQIKLNSIKINQSIEIENNKVLGDKEKIHRVLSNIIKNSIEYTNDGTIDIRVEENSVNKTKSIFKIIIKDSGIGMTNEQVERAFDKFYTAKGSKTYKSGGLGIGLSISKGILDKMNATISLESKYNEGTTFIIEIPLDIVPIKNTSNATALKLCDYSSKKIMLVEDIDINIILLERILSQTKINIVVAKNGKEAFDLFKDSDDIDIIFMDLQMPVMDGFEAARLIRSLNTKKSKEVPIIAVSANAVEEDTNKIKYSGMNENFQKPINIERLLTILDKYIGDNK